VTAGVDVQRFVPRPDGVIEGQRRVAADEFVVPLLNEEHRHLKATG
jgi:hypothetical protein